MALGMREDGSRVFVRGSEESEDFGVLEGMDSSEETGLKDESEDNLGDSGFKKVKGRRRTGALGIELEVSEELEGLGVVDTGGLDVTYDWEKETVGKGEDIVSENDDGEVSEIDDGEEDSSSAKADGNSGLVDQEKVASVEEVTGSSTVAELLVRPTASSFRMEACRKRNSERIGRVAFFLIPEFDEDRKTDDLKGLYFGWYVLNVVVSSSVCL